MRRATNNDAAAPISGGGRAPKLMAALTLGALGLAACSSGVESAPSSSAQPPPDQLLPSASLSAAAAAAAPEKRTAFGLELPPGFRMRSNDYRIVSADGPMAPADLANYVRAHISGGTEEVGPDKTVFLLPTIKDPAYALPGKLRIEVSGSQKRARLTVYYTAPPPESPAPSSGNPGPVTDDSASPKR